MEAVANTLRVSECLCVPDRFEDELSATAEGIRAFILANTTPERSDRLWPSDYAVFETNPLGLAYGACGTALYLHNSGLQLPNAIVVWMVQAARSADELPPGLFLGSAGIAASFIDMGMTDVGRSVLSSTFDSPVLFDDCTLFLGAAGWGYASLYGHYRLGEQSLLEWAVRAGDHIVSTAREEGEDLCWPCSIDGRVHFGFGYGASGIALFLLLLGRATGNTHFIDAARRAFDYDLAHRVETRYGIYWSRYAGDVRSLGYLLHGTAGVGRVAIRFYRHLREQKYLDLVSRLADSLAFKWTILTGWFDGMAGVGEFLLEASELAMNDEWRARAVDLAETILWYRVHRPTGIAFPGRALARLSTDLGTGSAGVGMFLDAVRGNTPPQILSFDLR